MEKAVSKLKKIQNEMTELHQTLSKHEADSNRKEIVRIEKRLMSLVNKSISIIEKHPKP